MQASAPSMVAAWECKTLAAPCDPCCLTWTGSFPRMQKHTCNSWDKMSTSVCVAQWLLPTWLMLSATARCIFVNTSLPAESILCCTRFGLSPCLQCKINVLAASSVRSWTLLTLCKKANGVFAISRDIFQESNHIYLQLRWPNMSWQNQETAWDSNS